ncbi:unnamed protein product [Staurois parvus]|uniref:Uncharacterized protein n=1 Tax=Staurois parvus TaxID=386267 RepID=A0ABN9EI09_9NEOB|nr:unnamed protein product [Staurois parvus]
MGLPGNRGSWGPVSLPKLKKPYEKAFAFMRIHKIFRSCKKGTHDWQRT